MVYAKLNNQSTSALPQSGDSGGIIYDKNNKKGLWRIVWQRNYEWGKITCYFLVQNSPLTL